MFRENPAKKFGEREFFEETTLLIIDIVSTPQILLFISVFCSFKWSKQEITI
jgi:hypothetical protein